MISNNSLSNHLNTFKNKKDSTQENIPLQVKPMEGFFMPIITVLLLTFKVLVFGYSSKIIFTTDWNFLETICIGTAINLLLIHIEDLFHKT